MAADSGSMIHVEHHSIPLFRCLNMCRTLLVIFTLCVLVHIHMHMRVCVCVCFYLSVLFPCIDPWFSLV